MRRFVVFACLVVGCDRPEPPPDPPSGAGGGGEGGSAPVSAGGGGEEGAAAEEGAAQDEGGGTPPNSTDNRMPLLDADHSLYARFEGTAFANDCKADSDCHQGGCSSEVCSADKSVVTTCDALPLLFREEAACGCVADQCQWFATGPERFRPPGSSSEVPEANKGENPGGTIADCGGKTCKPGQECIEYFGIAGATGPTFHSCEIRCKRGAATCPKGTTCITIADGPGSVCR